MNELLGLVDALAAELGRPVGVDDRQFRSLAYSSHVEQVDRVRRDSILQRAAPPEVIAWLESRGLQTAEGVVRVPANAELEMNARVCVPIRFDGTLLGYLWLIDEPVPLRAAELAAAEARAAELGVELYRARRLEHGERERERELLAQLVGRRDGDPAAAAGALLDDGLLPATAAYAVLVLQASGGPHEPVPDPVRVRLATAAESPVPDRVRVRLATESPVRDPVRVRLAAESPVPDPVRVRLATAAESPVPDPVRVRVATAAESPVPDPVRVRLATAAESVRRGLAPHHLLVLVSGEQVVAVLACAGRAELEKRARALADAAAGTLADTPDWKPLVGASDAHPTASALAGAYEQARLALRVGRAVEGLGPVVSWNAIGAYRALAALLPEGAAPPPAAALERLLACGEAQVLVPTLERYLDLGGDARAASEALHLHRSSLYGRLHRIEEVAGVDLRSGEDRLELHLALRLRRLAGAAYAAGARSEPNAPR